MLTLLNCDFYRFKKNRSFRSLYILISLMGLVLVLLLKNDIKLGISIIGSLTLFTSPQEVFMAGLDFRKGLGMIVAIMVTLFISEEFSCKTMKLKLIVKKSKYKIYFSKLIEAISIAISIVLVYEIVVIIGGLLGFYNIEELVNISNIGRLIIGVLIYASIGAIICFINMFFQNMFTSIIVSLAYIILNDTFSSIIKIIFTRVNMKSLGIMKLLLNTQTNNLYFEIKVINCFQSFLSFLLLTSVIVIVGGKIFESTDINS